MRLGKLLGTLSHMCGKHEGDNARCSALVIKTVLNRIISIVRVPSLLPNKDNTINRDDDA